LLPWAD